MSDAIIKKRPLSKFTWFAFFVNRIQIHLQVLGGDKAEASHKQQGENAFDNHCDGLPTKLFNNRAVDLVIAIRFHTKLGGKVSNATAQTRKGRGVFETQSLNGRSLWQQIERRRCCLSKKIVGESSTAVK